MRVGRSGKPGRTPLLEVWEALGAFFDTPGSIASPRALYAVGTDGGAISTLYTLAGGVAPTHTVRNGHVVRAFAPGTNQASVATLKYAFPLSHEVLDYPASFRQQRRYVWETVVERTSPLVAGVKMEIGYVDDPGNELSLVNDNGLIIQSVSTVNAGRFTVWTKNSGGAVTQGADLGVTPEGQLVHVKFEYFDITVPSLNIYLNGTLKATFAAAALAALNPAVNEPMNLNVHSGGNPNTIGQVDFQYDSHLLIESL